MPLAEFHHEHPLVRELLNQLGHGDRHAPTLAEVAAHVDEIGAFLPKVELLLVLHVDLLDDGREVKGGLEQREEVSEHLRLRQVLEHHRRDVPVLHLHRDLARRRSAGAPQPADVHLRDRAA